MNASGFAWFFGGFFVGWIAGISVLAIALLSMAGRL